MCACKYFNIGDFRFNWLLWESEKYKKQSNTYETKDFYIENKKDFYVENKKGFLCGKPPYNVQR